MRTPATRRLTPPAALAAAVVALAAVPTAAFAQPSCSGTIGGPGQTVGDVEVIEGETCTIAPGTTVNSVWAVGQEGQGGVLNATGVSITGDADPAVRLSGSGVINITDSRIAGSLTADNGIFCASSCTTPGPTGAIDITGSTIAGDVSAHTGPVQVPITLRNTRVAGLVALDNTNGPINLIGGSIGSSLSLTGNNRPITISSERVGASGGPGQVNNITGVVGGVSSADIYANTGGVQIADTSFAGQLACDQNVPWPVDDGGNTITGGGTGECFGFGSSSPPSPSPSPSSPSSGPSPFPHPTAPPIELVGLSKAPTFQRGALVLRLRCAASTAGSCSERIHIVITDRGHRLSQMSRHINLGPGKRRVLTVRLNRKWRSPLAHHRGRVILTVGNQTMYNGPIF